MAYRVFPSGQVPTAEVLQKYLMDQVVITCASTARPPTPIPGMTIFEVDTGTFRVWYGGVWARLAKTGDWTDSGALTAPGGITTTTVTASGTVSTTGDMSARGLMISRMVKGKIHTGSLSDSSNSATTTYSTVSFANVQNVPVIAGHAYRASFQVGYAGTVSDDRIRYGLWDGAVGGTQLGNQEPLYRVILGAAGGSFVACNPTFVWAAPTTTTIGNVTLGHQRFSGTGTVYTRIETTSFIAIIEDLGLASTITNL